MLCDYDDIRMRWDIANNKIKELSQQYILHCYKRINRKHNNNNIYLKSNIQCT